MVALAVGASLLVQGGGCPSGSVEGCVSEPVGGWAGAWVRIVAGTVVVVLALGRALRGRGSRGRGPRDR